MTEPKYDEDTVNLGYLKKVISDTEENIEDTYKNVSRHYATKPNTPYYKGDTWIDGNIVYTCINSREIGLYTDSDWTTESGAKQEAERKNKTYLTQPSNYSAGDMWILQSDNDHKAGKKGEILISSAGRKEYNEDDWTNMLGYGTIKSINEVSNNLNNAINRIGNVEEAIQDGIIITFYQSSIPEAKHVGDLWYVTDELEGYIKGKIYRYDGTSWVVLNDPAIQEAFDEANEARLVADGKIQSFYSDTEPTENMGVGDLWIDLANNNQLYRYNGTNWVAVYDTRINDLVTSVDSVTERVTTIETDLGEIDLKVQENTTTITTIEGNVNNITNTQGEAEGKNIHLTDSAEEPFVDISLHGESTQNGTPTPDNRVEIENVEGKNIWNKSEISEKTQTVNMTVGELNVKDVPIPFTFSSYLISNALTDTNVRVSFMDSNNSNIGAVKFGNTVTSTNKRSSITINEIPEGTVKIRFGIRMQDGGHTEKTQLEAGTVATDYVPYNSLEIKNVGENLFNPSNAKDGYVNNNNGQILGINIKNKNTGYIKIDGGEKYFILSNKLSGNWGSWYDKDKKFISGIALGAVDKGIVTAPNYAYFINFTVSYDNNNPDYANNVMIARSDKEIPYKPYQEQKVDFPLAEGQKLMEGSYLADDGIHHSRKQVEIDVTQIRAVTSYNNIDYASIPKPSDFVGYNNYMYYEILCNKAISQKITSWDNTENINKISSQAEKTKFYLGFEKGTTLEQMKTALANTVIEYDLAEEETVPYTAEQQEAWEKIKAMYTYKNVTNITSTAYAKVTYMRDNGLDVYETKQNAEKNYTETTKKLAEQKITVDGIVSEVSETKSNINTINNNLIELNETVSTTEQRVNEYEIKFEEKTKTINEELKENSETIKSMSYTFNTDELSIAKSDDPVNAKINNSGMRVYSYNELKAIFNDKGTGIQKLIVVGSAQIGNLQIVKATDENGEACTDFHHLVSNIQNLEDLEVG